MKKKKPLSVYERIKRAAKMRRGLRLTAEDCFNLFYMDDAIATRANRDELNRQGVPDSEQ